MGKFDIAVIAIEDEKDDVIRRFEAEMFAKYKKAVGPFVPLFNELGCDLKLEQWWVNYNHDTWSEKHLPVEKGYECFVYCKVERNGKEVSFNEGEDYDYYLVTSWTISSYMRRGFKKLKVKLYASIDDVDSKLTEFLSQLKQKHSETFENYSLQRKTKNPAQNR